MSEPEQSELDALRLRILALELKLTHLRRDKDELILALQRCLLSDRRRVH